MNIDNRKGAVMGRRRYIPASMNNSIILSFLHDSTADDEELVDLLHQELSKWLLQFSEDYRQYGLPIDERVGDGGLSFPLELDVYHVGVGFSSSSTRDKTEVDTITVERELEEGFHRRYYRYVYTLNKREDPS